MNKLTTIGKKEQANINRRTAMIRAAYNPQTTEECADLYRSAEEIATVTAIAVKDGLQGKALLQAKKNLCGDEWDAPKLNKKTLAKWVNFCQSIDAVRTVDGNLYPSRNVSYLLDFAGYKERGGEIETASHYREVKKIAGKDTKTIDKTYKEAGGSKNKTAKALIQNLTKKKIFVMNLFINEVGECPEPGMTSLQVSYAMTKKLPVMSEAEWKTWYRTASRCMHPDHGGSEHDFSILNSINEMITIVIDNQKQREANNKWENDYTQWKKDNNYENDFVEEEKIKEQK